MRKISAISPTLLQRIGLIILCLTLLLLLFYAAPASHARTIVPNLQPTTTITDAAIPTPSASTSQPAPNSPTSAASTDTAPTTASPTPVAIVADPQDVPVQIRQQADGSYSGHLRLMAVGSVPTMIVLTYDLHSTDVRAPAVIERSHITVIPEVTSPSDHVITNLQINIKDVAQPGTYNGLIALLQPQQLITEALTIPVVLDASVAPALTPLAGTDSIKMQLVNCGDWLGLDCRLAEWVLPESNQATSRVLEFSNPNAALVEITDGTILLNGGQPGNQLSNRAATPVIDWNPITTPLSGTATVSPTLTATGTPLSPTGTPSGSATASPTLTGTGTPLPPASTPSGSATVSPTLTVGGIPSSFTTKTVPGNAIIKIPMWLSPNAIPPDHYSGLVVLTLVGQPNRIQLPIDIKVRSGPFLPLMALFLGLAFGQLIIHMRGRGEELNKASLNLSRLAGQLQTSSDLDKPILTHLYDEARHTIAIGDYELANQQINAAIERIAILQRLDVVTTTDQNRADMSEIRIFVQQGKLAEAKKKLDKIDPPPPSATGQLPLQAAEGAAREIPQDPPPTGWKRLMATLRQKFAPTQHYWRVLALSLAVLLLMVLCALIVNVRDAWMVHPNLTWGAVIVLLVLLAVFVSWAANSAWVRDVLVFRVAPLLRVFLRLAVLLGLALWGLNKLYVDQTTSFFGATPFGDYIALVLWGITSNVVSNAFNFLIKVPTPSTPTGGAPTAT
ncbi:MAG: hypothetical protein M3Z04_23470 [Chloroflexota bacterium]|nr:hypothetical protein [Chloroflexota bacterium]